MTAPPLTFLAPPSFGDHLDDSSPHFPSATSPVRSTAHMASGRQVAATVRMTRGAREAAVGMKVGDADIQRCLDAPDDVSPDENTPSRTRFRRDQFIVLAGADGMVLRIDRRSR
jgi:uncharacterized protein (DUF58 family)